MIKVLSGGIGIALLIYGLQFKKSAVWIAAQVNHIYGLLSGLRLAKTEEVEHEVLITLSTL